MNWVDRACRFGTRNNPPRPQWDEPLVTDFEYAVRFALGILILALIAAPPVVLGLVFGPVGVFVGVCLSVLLACCPVIIIVREDEEPA